MAMRSVASRWALLLLAVFVSAGAVSCQLFESYGGRPYLGPGCSSGQVESCTCDEDRPGRRECRSDGTFGACRCIDDGGATADGNIVPDSGERIELADLTSCAESAEPADSFVVFDATKIKGVYGPLPGMSRFDFVSSSRLWSDGADPNEPDESGVREFASTLMSDRRYGLNIQRWGWSTETIDKYVEIAEWTKDEAPNALIGFYDMPPFRDFEADRRELLQAIRGPNLDQLTEWATRWNEGARRVAERVDFVMPSVFPVTDDLELWKMYATAKICEARNYESLGRRVYPAVWMQWSAGIPGREGRGFVSRERWKSMLQHVRGLGVPGIVVYTNQNNGDGERLTWTSNEQGEDPQKNSEWYDVLDELFL